MVDSLFSGHILGLLLIGLLAGAYAVQKLAPKIGRRFLAADHLKPLGLLTLTPQCSVAVIRAGSETLVLGLTPHAVTLLTKTLVRDGEKSTENAEAMEKREDGESTVMKGTADLGAVL
ncbi:MAG: flagellar biosynthetic protein FliO [Deltaproteobacteria bacterium]|nr:flagellar biosynthetic protein FliO [Deltaproteobacteria bacterium]